MTQMDDKLGAILGDPKMMQQIMAMAQSLSGAQEQEQHPQPSPSGLDPAMMQSILSLAGQAGIDPHQQTLLKALTPYLTHQRIAKLEKAMRAARLASAASSFLGSGGLTFLTGR